ncbi:MAG: TatD family hydrolase [Treponema sp.]|nr:TatD family hydrolase [Treponema sp.]
MYSDTHFHFENFVSRGINAQETLSNLAESDCFFALDIGTEHDDLIHRIQTVKDAVKSLSDKAVQDKCKKFLYFSAGIWPSPEEIKNRNKNIEILKEKIKEAENSSNNDSFNTKIIALGECGLDHHWNPSGEDHRRAEDFSNNMLQSEKELFEMQLLLAKDLSLPVIIHSRDAFTDTLESIKKIGYHNGIIHCYSYGKSEAKEFLDCGWYISFSGSVTYTKKRCMNEMEELIKSIPDDRILVETDSPYLAPVPFRGKVNSPSLIKNTYDFIAKIKGISSEELSILVDNNISKLFNGNL